ncbi:hypothetical protein AOLI_G00287010 [Acnodon oligacanthus]
MADKGFVIQDLLYERKVKLILPAVTKRGMQLSEQDTTNTRRIANVRVHVERVIRAPRCLHRSLDCNQYLRRVAQAAAFTWVHTGFQKYKVTLFVQEYTTDLPTMQEYQEH